MFLTVCLNKSFRDTSIKVNFQMRKFSHRFANQCDCSSLIKNYVMRIKEIPEDKRPREKLSKAGSEMLSVEELLAIIIGSGTQGISALELARKILEKSSYSLTNLSSMSLDELRKIKGIGFAKSIVIKAVFELMKRTLNEQLQEKFNKLIQGPEDVIEIMSQFFYGIDRERVYALFLRNGKIWGTNPCLISEGGFTSATIDIRVILRECLLRGATSIILCHNHPSGNLTPSQEDILITRKLKEACEVLSIDLLDHIIFSSTQRNKAISIMGSL